MTGWADVTQPFDLATGGDLAKALDGVRSAGIVDGALVAHDDGCPCVEDDAASERCTCEIVRIHPIRTTPYPTGRRTA